jgi:PAS domain S-box-containing protein
MSVTETGTSRIPGGREFQEEEDQWKFAIEGAELGTWDYNPATDRFTANDRLKQWFGLDLIEEVELPLAIASMFEEDRERVTAAIQRALQYDSGGYYDIMFTLAPPGASDHRIVRAKGRAWFNEQKLAYRFNGIMQDITGQEIARKKIEDSELFARNLIHYSEAAQAIWLGPDMVFSMANDKMLKMLGREAAEVDGKAFMEAIPELKETSLLTRLREVLRTGQTYIQPEEPFTLIRYGKPYIGYYNYSYKALRNAAGENYGIICTALEVTEQVLARQQLEASEIFSRNIFHNSVASQIVYTGEDMIITMANQRVLEMLGRDSSAIGKPFMEVSPELKDTSLMDRLRHVLHTGETYYQPEEKFDLVKYGRLHTGYFNFTYQALADANGVNYAVLGTATEITDMVLSRKKTEQTEQKALLAIESADLGTYEIDLQTDHMITSDRFNAIWGMRQSFPRSKIVDFIHPEDRAMREEAHRQSILTGRLHYEARVVWEDGSAHWVRIKGKVLYNEAGQATTLIGVIQDITEQKLFAEEMTKQVKQRTLELQRSNDDLLQFAHVISHDLKEPVRKITVFSNRLQEEMSGMLDEKGRSYLAKVQNATNRMFSMIEGVLAYSALSSSEQLIETVAIAETIRQIQSDLEVLIQQKKAGFTIGELPRIEGASVLIYQLFYNLINNALKFSRPETAPVVVISSSVAGDYVCISIADNGIGFDQENAEKIFETFTRLHSKDKFEGTGLGLALCKKIAERHGGFIEATSNKKQGAVFTVHLPLKQKGTNIK